MACLTEDGRSIPNDRNKKVIVDIDPFARHQFESMMMRKYFDFSIFESTQLKRRYLHG